MGKCPYCDYETPPSDDLQATAQAEISHMNENHRDVIRERLQAIGIHPDDVKDYPFEAFKDEEVIEIRCLWQKTDYGHISLIAAARGYGGRELGSYQDGITNENFEHIRREQQQSAPDWRLVESVIKVPSRSVEELFTDGTEIPIVE